MFKKKKENKMVWLVIEKLNYSTGRESFRVAKKAYSLADAVGFKDALDKLSDDVDQTYFLATEIESGFNEVVKLHNKSVEDGSYYKSHPEVKRPEAK